MSLLKVLAKFPTGSLARQLFYGVLVGIALSLTTSSLSSYYQQRRRKIAEAAFEPRPIELRSDEVVDGVTGLIGLVFTRYSGSKHSLCVPGNTPLVRISSLSNALGVEILGKAEVVSRSSWRLCCCSPSRSS